MESEMTQGARYLTNAAIYKRETYLQSCGIGVNHLRPRPEREIPVHLHEFVELTVIEEGEAVHRVLNDETVVPAGYMLIINTAVPHKLYPADEKNPPSIYNICFDPSALQEPELENPASPRFCCGLFRNSTLASGIQLTPEELNMVTRHCSTMLWETEEKPPEWELSLRAQLTLLLVLMSRRCQPAVSGKTVSEKERLAAVALLQATNANLADPDLTLSKIAESLYYSKSYLSKAFCKVTGEHYAEYLNNLRIAKACQLLRKTDMTTREIAQNCGMRDLPSFYRQFRSRMEVSPGQYRFNETGVAPADDMGAEGLLPEE